MKKVILSVVCIIFVMAVGGLTYLYTAFPAVEPAKEISIERTPEQIKHGKYLAEHVVLCIDCHSVRDWSKFSGPITPGTYGRGGDVFDETMGFPGTFYARNITPHNLADWTDGEIYRVITSGVTKDNLPIFPVMPYPSYGQMDPEDVKSIIAYIRTLEPISYKTPESKANFPVNLIMRTMPKSAEPKERPSTQDTLAYGKYLTTIAACADCHTPREQGTPIEDLYLAGGSEFLMPFGTIKSANLTPHRQTGIGTWSKEQFVNRFKQYDVPSDSLPNVKPDQFNSIMPWNMYAGMKKEDLEAIYHYLQSLEPIDHRVIRYIPANNLSAARELKD